MKRFVTIIFVFLVLVCFVIGVFYNHIDVLLLTYIGTLLGGATGGIATMIGVTYTLNWSSKSENDKRLNHKRLLLAELKRNGKILKSLTYDCDLKEVDRLQGGIWKTINIDAAWIPSKTFDELFNFYMEIWGLKKMVQKNNYKIKPIEKIAILVEKSLEIEKLLSAIK